MSHHTQNVPMYLCTFMRNWARSYCILVKVLGLCTFFFWLAPSQLPIGHTSVGYLIICHSTLCGLLSCPSVYAYWLDAFSHLPVGYLLIPWMLEHLSFDHPSSSEFSIGCLLSVVCYMMRLLFCDQTLVLLTFRDMYILFMLIVHC